MKTASLLLLSACLAVAHAASFEPAIAPLATEYRAKLEKIGEKRDESIRTARDTYLVALDAAQKEAYTQADSALTGKIDAEIKAVKLDGLSSTEGFPRKLLSSRKLFEKALQKAQSDAERDAKPLGSAYLSDLNRIPVGQGASPLLIRQINSEKKALTLGIVGPIINPELDLPGTGWWPTDKPNETWKFKLEDGNVRLDSYLLSFPKQDEIVIQWQGNWFKGKLAKNGHTILENDVPKLILRKE